MFSENLKALRKARGYTQEELAIKLHVVRQTVSKWEKGLSVPDAEMLSRMAEILEVSVSELLGAQTHVEDNRNEVAIQLAKISEQMAIRNRRARRIWQVIGLILLAIILLVILNFNVYKANTHSVTVETYPEEITSESE